MRHRLDLGLVLGGFPADAHPNVRQVATLGVEPLHLLVRREKLARIPRRRSTCSAVCESRSANKARTVRSWPPTCCDSPACGRRPRDDAGRLSRRVYTRESRNDRQLRTWKRAAAPVRAVLAERLPDAVFIVDSLPSPLVDELVKTAGYQLVPLPYATALHLNNRRDDAHEARGLESNRHRSDHDSGLYLWNRAGRAAAGLPDVRVAAVARGAQGRVDDGGRATAAGARQGRWPSGITSTSTPAMR